MERAGTRCPLSIEEAFPAQRADLMRRPGGSPVPSSMVRRSAVEESCTWTMRPTSWTVWTSTPLTLDREGEVDVSKLEELPVGVLNRGGAPTAHR